MSEQYPDDPYANVDRAGLILRLTRAEKELKQTRSAIRGAAAALSTPLRS